MSRKIEALQEAAALKAQQAYERVEKALERMIKENQKINFQTVAHSANVSTAYLYKHEELKNRIETLRYQQKNRSKPKHPPQASDNSKNRIIQTLRDENKKLRDEMTEVKKLNEVLTGQVYQKQESSNLVERLKAENQRLTNENNQLKASLEETLQTVEKLKAQALESNPKVTSLSERTKTVISDEITSELEQLGITLNTTLRKKIKAAPEEQILEAIEALKDQLTRSDIKNPGGWLASAIEKGWTKSEAIPTQKSPPYQPPSTSIPPLSNQEDKEVMKPDTLLARLKQLRTKGNSQDD